MSDEKEKIPTCMYKRGKFGRIESQVFDHPSSVPDGWVDSPAKCPEAAKPRAKKTPKPSEDAS